MELFNKKSKADELLEMLALEKIEFGRYRDCHLEDNGKLIVVKTQCGGRNREEYQDVFDRMREHRYYRTDYDEIDDRYCSFVFTVPPIFMDITEKWCIDNDGGNVCL